MEKEKEQDKLGKTILLLILIAISMQRYLFNSEINSHIALVTIVPGTIIILLLIINITHPDNSTYKKGIKMLLIFSIVILLILSMLTCYFTKLSEAYNH
jgi:glycerol uptake facilitator-like aquaporin